MPVTEALSAVERPTVEKGPTMKSVGRYDSALQMFVQEPRELDMNRLTFLRWLAENNRIEHRIAGPSTGPMATPSESVAVPQEPAYT